MNFPSWLSPACAARGLIRHRRIVFVVAFLVAVLGTWRTVSAYRALRSELDELLPETAPSVTALSSARSRLEGLRTLGVVVHTGGEHNVAAANRFVDDLHQRLVDHPPQDLASIQRDVATERAFVERYGLQLLELEDLRELRRSIEARRDWEVARVTGNNLLEDEDEEPPVRLDELRSKYEQRFGVRPTWRGGRFVSDDGSTVVMILRSKGADYESDVKLLRRVQADVEALHFPQAYGAGMAVGYAGDIPTRIEEMDGLMVDLGASGLVVLILTVAIIVWYFGSWRALVVVALPLFCGTVATFAVVALPPLSIRHMNSNTAFLGSIIVGNGINSSIMLLARFREERLRGEALEHAIVTMVTTTWKPTLAAAAAASSAYGSLVFTDFRGFAQFGWMGGIGMLLCWLAAITLLPPLVWSVGAKMPARSSWAGATLARFSSITLGRRGVVLVGVAVLTALAVYGVSRRSNDWIEYDLSKLRRRDAWTQGERYWGQRMDATMGRFLTPAVVLAHDDHDATIIAQRLRTLMQQQRAGDVIASVRSMDELMPPDREQRLIEVRGIAEAMTPRVRSALSEQQRQIAETLLSPESMVPLTIDRIPDTIVAGLLDASGGPGRNVLVFPKPGRTWDATRLEPFAADVRTAAIVENREAPVTGSLLLSSDIAAAMKRDGPRTTAVSFVMVLLLCAAAFRSFKLSIAAIASLCVGVALMLGMMAWSGQKLNFSNFVALPITFGIAADYSINVLKRLQQGGNQALEGALAATGGAVAVCSATTIIGYGSLLAAQNQALFSFGLFAVVGELTCLVTAVVVLPAGLSWLRPVLARTRVLQARASRPP